MSLFRASEQWAWKAMELFGLRACKVDFFLVESMEVANLIL